MTNEAIPEQHGLRYLPISLFASVMGVSGLAIATQKLEIMFAWPTIFSSSLLVLSVVLWAGIFIAYTVKVLRYPEALVEELDHPVRLSFFPTSSIGLLLISVILVGINLQVAAVIWWIGAIAQLGFMLIILDRWIHR